MPRAHSFIFGDRYSRVDPKLFDPAAKIWVNISKKIDCRVVFQVNFNCFQLWEEFRATGSLNGSNIQNIFSLIQNIAIRLKTLTKLLTLIEPFDLTSKSRMYFADWSIEMSKLYEQLLMNIKYPRVCFVEIFHPMTFKCMFLIPFKNVCSVPWYWYHVALLDEKEHFHGSIHKLIC